MEMPSAAWRAVDIGYHFETDFRMRPDFTGYRDEGLWNSTLTNAAGQAFSGDGRIVLGVSFQPWSYCIQGSKDTETGVL
jgi:hypothetical protein